MISQSRLQELLAQARAKLEAEKNKPAQEKLHELSEKLTGPVPVEVSFRGTGIADEAVEAGSEPAIEAAAELIAGAAETLSELPPEEPKTYGVARAVTLNEKQQKFCDLIVSGQDCILIGPAGTGKTTTFRQATRMLVDSETIPLIVEPTKWLQVGRPGIAIIAYTRKATNNIRHAVIDELKAHCLTAHKLLEFAPVIYEIEDPDNPGETKTTMRFEPKRNRFNPLPAELKLIIHEESSMEGTDLYALVEEAMPHPHQEAFSGDIQQLPPVFGPAILGFKMLELPTVELTEVYRQARDNPILDLAWKILEGDPKVFDTKGAYDEKYYNETLGKEVTRRRYPKLDALQRDQYNDKGELIGSLKFTCFQKKLAPELGLLTVAKQFTTWADNGYYNPDEDIILCPFNKAFGTIELNARIAQHLGVKRDATVHEVVAGFNKYYLAIGDRVLYDKEDAFITAIGRNPEYYGAKYQPASKHLDRWGHLQKPLSEEEKLEDFEASFGEMSDEELDRRLAAAAGDVEARVTASSHQITIQYAYGDGEDKYEVLDKASQVNNLLGGYAITVHKSQGSEWEKGFIVLHNTHAVMLSRELLYTAVTRNRKYLHVLAEPSSFEAGVGNPRIRGNTLAEKAKFFEGKLAKGQAESDAAKLTKKRGGTYKPAERTKRETPARYKDYSEDDSDIPSGTGTPAKYDSYDAGGKMVSVAEEAGKRDYVESVSERLSQRFAATAREEQRRKLAANYPEVEVARFADEGNTVEPFQVPSVPEAPDYWENEGGSGNVPTRKRTTDSDSTKVNDAQSASSNGESNSGLGEQPKDEAGRGRQDTTNQLSDRLAALKAKLAQAKK